MGRLRKGIFETSVIFRLSGQTKTFITLPEISVKVTGAQLPALYWESFSH